MAPAAYANGWETAQRKKNYSASQIRSDNPPADYLTKKRAASFGGRPPKAKDSTVAGRASHPSLKSQ